MLARGFLRVHCDGCGDDLFVAFSCKSRAVCPSCATRRMYDGADFLVGRVLPRVPFRQWVMSFPKRVRLRLALDASLVSRVLAIFLRAIFASQRRQARRLGRSGARTGAVTFVQRFSSALRLNVHFHCLVPDGVFVAEGSNPDCRPVFLGLPAPTDEEVEFINRKVARKVITLVGRLDDQVTGLPEAVVALGPTYAASLQPALPWPVNALPPRGRRSSNLEGFSLHANVCVRARDRLKLERLCRYGLRPPFALERMERLPSGGIAYRMKRPAPDGATHRVMTPLELLGALASLIPPPRVHLTRYHGIFAPHACDRAAVVPTPPSTDGASAGSAISGGEIPPHRQLPWADLLKKVFAVDVFLCDRCGGRRRVIAAITDPAAVRVILEHVGLPTRAPSVAPPRPPPQSSLDIEPSVDPGAHAEPAYE